MGYSRYIGRVGALAVALGIGAALGATPWLASAEPSTSGSSAHSASTTPSSDSSSTGAATSRNGAVSGKSDSTPSTASGSTQKSTKSPIGQVTSTIGVGHAVGVVAARDAFGRARCGGEHRRRGHRFTGRFLPVHRHRRHDGCRWVRAGLDGCDGARTAHHSAGDVGHHGCEDHPQRDRGEHTRLPHDGTRQQRRRHPRRC